MKDLFFQDKELEICMMCMHDMQFYLKGFNQNTNKQSHIGSQAQPSNLIPPTHVFIGQSLVLGFFSLDFNY